VPAGEDIFGHGEVLEDGRLLIHRDDAEPVSGLGIADPARFPVDDELAAVRLDDAREHLHER
jgi:hypothetical protein